MGKPFAAVQSPAYASNPKPFAKPFSLFGVQLKSAHDGGLREQIKHFGSGMTAEGQGQQLIEHSGDWVDAALGETGDQVGQASFAGNGPEHGVDQWRRPHQIGCDDEDLVWGRWLWLIE